VAACTGSGQAQVNYSAEATVATPTLVEVEPGVQVVADYDEPVFFNEGVYWRYEGGVWYRSPYHNRGWVRVEAPPVAVRRIQRPEMYVHYHANANMNARAEERHEENQERREEKQERKDDREVRHDEGEIKHDNGELAHDRGEIKADEKRGDDKEMKRDEKEMKRDEREKAKDQKELKKDEKRRDKDRR
jgi:hypothetical protein